MTYRLEWRLVGRGGRVLDTGETADDLTDELSAVQALNAFLSTFAIRGRNDAEGYWWGRKSADADMEVRLVLRPASPAGTGGPEPSRPDARDAKRAAEEAGLLLRKAAADPDGRIAIKRSRVGEWADDRSRLDLLARCGHLTFLGERMGPHLGGTFAVWEITPVGRARADLSP